MAVQQHEEKEQEVRRLLIELAAQRCGRTPDVDAPLTSLGIDSVGLMDLVTVVEKRFHIEIDEEIMDVETLDELVRYVCARRRQA